MGNSIKVERVEHTGWKRASLTVEMSFLVPLILFLIMSLILAVFYFHDKNILGAAAYETAVVGSTKMREKEQPTAGELQALYVERAGRKCILFPGSQAVVTVGKKEILVEAHASKGRFQVSVEKRASVTDPEKEIRRIRRIKEVLSGTNDHD